MSDNQTLVYKKKKTAADFLPVQILYQTTVLRLIDPYCSVPGYI